MDKKSNKKKNKYMNNKSDYSTKRILISNKKQNIFRSINSNKIKNIILLIGIIIFIFIFIIFIICYYTRPKNNIQLKEYFKRETICENGFFIPIDNLEKTKCKKCSIENCTKCYGTQIMDVCISCNSNNIAIYKNNKIAKCEIPCEIGRNEKCLECDQNNNICSSCNEGYYLPEDDEIKKTCKKCSIENCTKCEGDLSDDICISCKSNLIPIYKNNKIIKCEIPCETGKNEICLECDKNNNICYICNEWYYLPEDDEIKKTCKKCSMDNCTKCEGLLSHDICISCKSNLVPIYKNNKL